ncbi:MAG: zinc ribbon domain-containing protein [Deltaproteobacteria bacterium]|nr:MAG: zinc ribbon domain-containing protein [Deltaproteobacteria bacterium]
MPIYEYSCGQCHKGFEELVLSSQETVTCPACASSEVERRLSVFSSPGNRKAEGEVGAGGGCGCTPATCGCH